MPRIEPVDAHAAAPPVADLLTAVRRRMGTVPNFIATMAQSPAVATAYLACSRALSTGALAPRLREQLALVVGEANASRYCVAGHTALGKGVGLTERETCEARVGEPADAKERAALRFALAVLESRGAVADHELEAVRGAGYADGEIGEIAAHVALNVFTNYFNQMAQTEIDFPPPPELGVLRDSPADGGGAA